MSHGRDSVKTHLSFSPTFRLGLGYGRYRGNHFNGFSRLNPILVALGGKPLKWLPHDLVPMNPNLKVGENERLSLHRLYSAVVLTTLPAGPKALSEKTELKNLLRRVPKSASNPIEVSLTANEN